MRTHPTHRTRRDFLRVAGAGAAATALTACGRAPKQSQSGNDGTFTLYTNPGHVYPAYKEVVKQFEKDHGVSVSWQKYQWEDMQTKVLADLASGNVPDLFAQPGGSWAIPLAMTDDLLAIDDLAAKDKDMGYPNDWHAQAVESWQYNGKTYGVQLHLTCNQLYYNKGMLDAAGIKQPPATWDELLEAAKELTKGKVHGVALNQDYSYGSCWYVQNGVKYYDRSRKDVFVPREAAVDALRFQHDLIYRHEVSAVPTTSSDPTGPQKALTGERAAMIFTGPWDIAPITTGNPDVELAIAPPLEHEVHKTYFAGMGVAIPKKAKNPDLSWDLTKRLAALEVELEITKQAQMSMPRKSWTKEKAVTSDPLMAAIADALPLAVDWQRELAPTGKGPKMNDEYKSTYQSVLIEGNDPAKAMRRFDAAAKRVLG